VQNTCDDVLKIMERKYTIAQFIKLCDFIRKKSPNASITTDYIIGFPSETQTQFLESIENLKKIKFANIHMFPFSLHKDTKAAAIKQVFTEKEKQNRYEMIKKINEECKAIYLKSFLNKIVNVLFEHPKNPNIQNGKSQYYFDVFVSTKKNLQNSLLKVKVTSFRDGKLFGKIM
jgi:threonylcarbamoyladenosine tRNA methylthiotransferase MtaB